MKRTLLIFLLTLLNNWCAASSRILAPIENDCGEEVISGSGSDAGSGGDETIDTLCPTTTYSTYVPMNKPISTHLPSSENSLVHTISASEIKASSVTGVLLSEAPSVSFSVFREPTPSSESRQTSLQTSLFAPVTSGVVATGIGVTSTELSLFSKSHSRFSPKVITPTAAITIQPIPSSSMHQTTSPTQTVLVEATIARIPTVTPYSVLSPSIGVHLTNVEVTETLQMTTRPRPQPSSHMATHSPTQTLMPRSADIVTQSTAMSTAPTVGTASEYSASTGSRPIVSLEVGVGSSTTSLYIAVGSSVGGCVVIAAVAIPLIAMIVVLHKRRCHFRGTKYTIGGTLGRSSTTRDRSAELYLRMSQIDGRLTTQLSRSSLPSANAVTPPTLTRDTERKMFDNTMDTAYDSSTFKRSKHGTKSGSNDQETHRSPITEGAIASHFKSSSFTVQKQPGEDSNSHINAKRDTSFKLQPHTSQPHSSQPSTSGDEELVTSGKGRTAESSQKDVDDCEREDEPSQTCINAASTDMAAETDEKEIVVEFLSDERNNEYPTLEEKDENQNSTPTEKEDVNEESHSVEVEALEYSQCEPQFAVNRGKLKEGSHPQCDT